MNKNSKGASIAIGIAKVLSVSNVTYSINKSNPPQLNVMAEGQVNSSGWKNGQLIPWLYITPPADGIQDLDFVATTPDGVVLQVLTPISGSLSGPLVPWIKGFRIHASINTEQVLMGGATGSSPATQGGADDTDYWPWPWSVVPNK